MMKPLSSGMLRGNPGDFAAVRPLLARDVVELHATLSARRFGATKYVVSSDARLSGGSQLRRGQTLLQSKPPLAGGAKPSSSQISELTWTIDVRKVLAVTRVNPRTGWVATGMDMRLAARTCSAPERTSIDVSVRCLKSSLWRMPTSWRLSADQSNAIQGSSAIVRVNAPSGETIDRPVRPSKAIHSPFGAHLTGESGTMSGDSTWGGAFAPTRVLASDHLPAFPPAF